MVVYDQFAVIEIILFDIDDILFILHSAVLSENCSNDSSSVLSYFIKAYWLFTFLSTFSNLIRFVGKDSFIYKTLFFQNVFIAKTFALNFRGSFAF